MGLSSAAVFVTNENEFIHEDRYNGEDFVFPPGEPVLVPFDAAVHMFGYQLADQTDVLVRLGWAMMYDPVKKQMVENPDGVRKLANFVFEEATVQPRSALAKALQRSELA